jgi:protocatechuate 3,4-dioxygenase beta subunit
MPTPKDHNDFGGLHGDLLATGAAIDRRQMLRLALRLGLSLGALRLLGCGSEESSAAPDACDRIPEETAGPFAADGSNGQDVLSQSGVVRNDIRSSFAGLTGIAEGISLNIALTIVSAATCAPLAAHAVYVWHCDREGRYSLYSDGAADQNYLRGVQETDVDGRVAFTSIFPGCYGGRWPHIHFEVYPSLDAATKAGNQVATSQIALPKAACDEVYATVGYEASVVNLSEVTLATDSVFRDGASLELATMAGNLATGLTAILTVAV